MSEDAVTADPNEFGPDGQDVTTNQTDNAAEAAQEGDQAE